jgi:predicted glutamine amidotransferase
MCEIFFIHGKNQTIQNQNFLNLLTTAIEEASFNNADGFGVFNEEGEVYKSKEKFKYKHLSKVYKRFKDSEFVVIHLRMATEGAVIKKNSHPFRHNSNILVHNGMVTTPSTYEEGRADSYQMLRDIYKRKGHDTVKAVKQSLEKTTGSVSVFLYDYKNDLYYFRDGSDFTFAELTDSNELVGATRKSRLYTAFGEQRLSFQNTEENQIYHIEKGEVKEIADFEMENLQRSTTDSVYGHGYGYGRRTHVIRESDYEKYKEKKEKRKREDEPLRELFE